MSRRDGCTEFDEVRVISLPQPITAAVNRLLREERGWQLLDVRITDKPSDGNAGVMVVYVLGHVALAPTPHDSPTDFSGVNDGS